MEQLKTIKSFLVDHTKLDKGIYLSRVDGDVFTYDIRFIKPNTPPFLDYAAIHTIEHLFATFIRSGKFAQNIIYFGPMGCRTGFYLLVTHLSGKEVIKLVKDALNFIVTFNASIPGATAKECGNYLEHDLKHAKFYTQNLIPIINNWNIENLSYNN